MFHDENIDKYLNKLRNIKSNIILKNKGDCNTNIQIWRYQHQLYKKR